MFALPLPLQKEPSCQAAWLPKSSCQPGDWKQYCCCKSWPPKHWRVVPDFFMNGLPVTRAMRKARSPPQALTATLEELGISATVLGSRRCWYLALTTHCLKKVSLNVQLPSPADPQAQTDGPKVAQRCPADLTGGSVPPRHSWGCWMGLEDATNTLWLCSWPGNKEDASLNMRPPRCEGHSSAAAASGERFFQRMMALHTWSTSLETQHRATLAKLFCGICVIQDILSFSFALMKLFLCFRDKVLLFETSGLGVWIMDCRNPGGDGAQRGRGRASDDLSTLRLQEAPLSLRNLRFPPFLLGIAGSLQSKWHFQKVFSNCNHLPVLSSNVALSSVFLCLVIFPPFLPFFPHPQIASHHFFILMVLLLLPFLSHTFLSN